MTATKELGKYELVPTKEQLMAVVEFFRRTATATGRVNFTQRQMFEHPAVAQQFKSASYLNGVTTYLANEGFVTKVEVGNRHLGSVWDVSKLIADYDQVITREILGIQKPQREETGELILPENVEIEIIRKEDKAPEEPKKVMKYIPPEVPKQNNQAVMEELREAISDMMGYLQALPTEMSSHLRHISNQLELTDEARMAKLQEDYSKLQQEHAALTQKYGSFQIKHENTIATIEAEKKDLEDEVRSLKTELEEVRGKANYNTTHIYRQRNYIMDEVDRMTNAPAWTLKQNKNHYRTSIEDKLDAIMKEIGIEKE